MVLSIYRWSSGIKQVCHLLGAHGESLQCELNWFNLLFLSKSYAEYSQLGHSWLIWSRWYPQKEVSSMCRMCWKVSPCQARWFPSLYIVRTGSHLQPPKVLWSGTTRLVFHSLVMGSAAPVWWLDIFLVPKGPTLLPWEHTEAKMRFFEKKNPSFFKHSLW